MDSNIQERFPNASVPVLQRFLAANKNDSTKAIKQYEQHLQWRQENDIDNIEDFEFKESKQVLECYPHGFAAGCDKQDRVIYIERLGELQLQVIFSVTTHQKLIKHFIQQMELLESPIVVILDLKGSNMKLISKSVITMVQQIVRMYSDNYPELLHKLYIVNAPMMFQQIWSIIKSSIDESTKQKITITGQEYKEMFNQIIDPQNLPEFLGGQDKRPLSSDLKQTLNKQAEEDEDEDDDENALEQLKLALSGFGLSQPKNKAPHNPDKYQLNTQINAPISDTPMHTETDDYN